MILPWLAFFILMTILVTSSILTKLHFDGRVILILWFALAVVNNLIFMSWAKKNLNERLRDMATQRFAPKTGSFRAANPALDKTTPDLPPVIR